MAQSIIDISAKRCDLIMQYNLASVNGSKLLSNLLNSKNSLSISRFPNIFDLSAHYLTNNSNRFIDYGKAHCKFSLVTSVFLWLKKRWIPY